MMKDYNTHRDAAIKWLNSKRDFNKGIEILRNSGFRPVVVKVLSRKGQTAKAANERLLSLMRDLVKAWVKPEISLVDTDEVLGVINGIEIGSAQDCTSPGSIFVAAEKADELPSSIAEVVRKYRDSYMLREKIRNQMRELGEANDEDTVAKRKTLSDAIKIQSDIQDKLYPLYAKFLDNGELPASSAIEEAEKTEVPAARLDIERSAGKLSEMSKSELQKLRKSLMTKVIRSRNMLTYQQETKADKENPIPQGDIRRTKYESKINRLVKRVEEIDQQIASMA